MGFGDQERALSAVPAQCNCQKTIYGHVLFHHLTDKRRVLRWYRLGEVVAAAVPLVNRYVALCGGITEVL